MGRRNLFFSRSAYQKPTDTRHSPRPSNARCKLKSLRQHDDSVRSVRIGEYSLPVSFQKMWTSKKEYDDSGLAVIPRKRYSLSVHVRFSSS